MRQAPCTLVGLATLLFTNNPTSGPLTVPSAWNASPTRRKRVYSFTTSHFLLSAVFPIRMSATRRQGFFSCCIPIAQHNAWCMVGIQQAFAE